jgi:hypothetical protein
MKRKRRRQKQEGTHRREKWTEGGIGRKMATKRREKKKRK